MFALQLQFYVTHEILVIINITNVSFNAILSPQYLLKIMCVCVCVYVYIYIIKKIRLI
jgi:hypothetical protein